MFPNCREKTQVHCYGAKNIHTQYQKKLDSCQNLSEMSIGSWYFKMIFFYTIHEIGKQMKFDISC